jgi:RNA polymerase sigma-70 factor (ECF subfamily)
VAVGLGLLTPWAPFSPGVSGRGPAAPVAMGRARSPLPARPADAHGRKPVSPGPGESPLAARSDEDLVRECLAAGRDGEAPFRELVSRYEERAFWIAKGLVGQSEDARDVAQEAFVRVFRSLDKFDASLKFYTWFYQIVVNLAIDQLRRTKKRPKVSLDELGEAGDQVPGDSESPGEAVERDETRRRVARVLTELPAKYRSIIVLRDLEGFDGKEVASIAGATHATVRWRLHKARQMFRAAWERIYGAQP